MRDHLKAYGLIEPMGTSGGAAPVEGPGSGLLESSCCWPTRPTWRRAAWRHFL